MMPGDFPLVAREYHDGLYPVSAYIMAKVSLEGKVTIFGISQIVSYMMIFCVDGTIMLTISYWMIG